MDSYLPAAELSKLSSNLEDDLIIIFLSFLKISLILVRTIFLFLFQSLTVKTYDFGILNFWSLHLMLINVLALVSIIENF